MRTITLFAILVLTLSGCKTLVPSIPVGDASGVTYYGTGVDWSTPDRAEKHCNKHESKAVLVFSKDFPAHKKYKCVTYAELERQKLAAEERKRQAEEDRIKREEIKIAKEREFIASIPKLPNSELCDSLISPAGKVKTWDKNYDLLNKEQLSRGLSNEDCNVITGRFTSEQKKIIAQIEKEQKAEKLKQQKISIMKKDCEELGFKDNTESMGNCILKMMELDQENSPKVVTTTNQTSNNAEMLDIERAKLKAEQERLEVEKQRAWIERQEQLNRIGTQSIDQGWCLMNGGGWGC